MRYHYLQVSTTTQTKEEAEIIARTLVERRLAACVQVVGPINSTYWWKGAIETAEEWLCIIKSEKNLYPQLDQTIRKLNANKVPEIVASPIVEGNKDYLKWLRSVLSITGQNRTP